jgi:hypothetical protein
MRESVHVIAVDDDVAITVGGLPGIVLLLSTNVWLQLMGSRLARNWPLFSCGQ